MKQVSVLHAVESALTPVTEWMSDVHNVLCSPALLRCCRLLLPVASFMESVHLIFGLPFPFRLLSFPALMSFPKNPAFS